jgi:hypothetical protein
MEVVAADSMAAGVVEDSTAAGVVEDSTAVVAVEDSMGVAGADSMAAERVVSVEVAATFMGEAVGSLAVAAEASAVVAEGTFAEVVVFVAGLPALLE